MIVVIARAVEAAGRMAAAGIVVADAAHAVIVDLAAVEAAETDTEIASPSFSRKPQSTCCGFFM